MESQTPAKPKRKSFLNFVLRNFFSNQDKKKKYGIKQLIKALGPKIKMNFRLYLTHQVPRLILNARINSRSDYFNELDLLLKVAEIDPDFNGNGYLKGFFKYQKKKEERHYLAIIGKKLSNLPQIQQNQQNTNLQKFGKEYYCNLIRQILQQNNLNDIERAKEILIDIINQRINNDQQKKYVIQVIQKLTIQ